MACDIFRCCRGRTWERTGVVVFAVKVEGEEVPGGVERHALVGASRGCRDEERAGCEEKPEGTERTREREHVREKERSVCRKPAERKGRVQRHQSGVLEEEKELSAFNSPFVAIDYE